MQKLLRDVQRLNARVEKLEKQNHRMKAMGIVVAVIVAAIFVGGQDKTNKVIQANEFQLIDASGNVRGTWETSESGAQLVEKDLTGRVTVGLSADKDAGMLLNNSDSFLLASPNGVNALSKSGENVFINVGEDAGGPSVSVTDKEGYSADLGRTDLVVPKTGKKEQTPTASLVLFNKDKNVLWSAP
jgi:hypothetical protein